MKNFKKQVINDFIPRIKEMIRKEEEHLEKLKEYKRKSSKKILFNFTKPVNVDEFISGVRKEIDEKSLV